MNEKELDNGGMGNDFYEDVDIKDHWNMGYRWRL